MIIQLHKVIFTIVCPDRDWHWNDHSNFCVFSCKSNHYLGVQGVSGRGQHLLLSSSSPGVVGPLLVHTWHPALICGSKKLSAIDTSHTLAIKPPQQVGQTRWVDRSQTLDPLRTRHAETAPTDWAEDIRKTQWPGRWCSKVAWAGKSAAGPQAKSQPSKAWRQTTQTSRTRSLYKPYANVLLPDTHGTPLPWKRQNQSLGRTLWLIHNDQCIQFSTLKFWTETQQSNLFSRLNKSR